MGKMLPSTQVASEGTLGLLGFLGYSFATKKLKDETMREMPYFHLILTVIN